jgi:transposase-like protein
METIKVNSRLFSEDLKKKIVNEIECGKSTVVGASRELNTTPSAVFQWLKTYSYYLKHHEFRN